MCFTHLFHSFNFFESFLNSYTGEKRSDFFISLASQDFHTEHIIVCIINKPLYNCWKVKTCNILSADIKDSLSGRSPKKQSV